MNKKNMIRKNEGPGIKKDRSVNHHCLQKIEEAIKITLSFGKYSNL
jgi:hypothetical protein